MFRKSAARQCSNLSSFLRSKLFCPRFRRSLSTRRSIYERTVSRSRSLSSTNSLLDSLEENMTNLKWKPFLLASCTILIYYFFSISLTFYNRYLFVNYKYPLSITIIHLIVKFTAAVTIRTLLDLTLNSRCGLSKSPRLTLDWSTYLSKVVPLGLASAADIGMSNWSLQYITVTLYTMSKSTVILFILFFSLIFKLEKWRRSIILIIGCISFGLFLFTFHSTEFNLFGFILVMIASMCSGLRWTLAQTLCQKHDMGLSNPVDMIYHIQPSMILALLPLALYVEGVSVISTEKFFRTDDLHQIASNMQWIMIGAFIAFFLESSEFLVVTFTSSLTLSVSGIFKEICIIYLAVLYNGNKLNQMNTAGLVICLLGITIHVVLKAKRANSESKKRFKRNYSGHALNEECDEDDTFEEDIFELENYTGMNNLHRKLNYKSNDPQLEAFLSNDIEEDFR